ncbi:MAG TPA: hypothetical protein HPP87_06555 [Planctomycetes bacterium]|nr:hypothetical protein [Planctomycetota bacterium]
MTKASGTEAGPCDNTNRSQAAHPSRRGLAAAEAAESGLRHHASRITQYETRATNTFRPPQLSSCGYC